MKKVMILVVLLLCFANTAFLSVHAQGSTFTTKYETGAFFAQTSDGSISLKLLNVGSVSHNYRVIIYSNANPRTSLVDTGATSISASYVSSASYTIPAATAISGSVTVYTDSPEVVPSLIVGPGCGSLPCTPMTFQIFPGQFSKAIGEF